MLTFASKYKNLYTILILLLVLHTTLSFCGCVLVEETNNFPHHFLPDVDTTQWQEGLLGGYVLVLALVRIALAFPKAKIAHILSWLITLNVSISTSFYEWVHDNVGRTISGLAYKSYDLTPMGRRVIYLSWAITIFHGLIVALLCKPKEGYGKYKKYILPVSVTVVVIGLLLIIFRNVIYEWLRSL